MAGRAWQLLRTRNPRTFTEKVRYKMLRDHRDLLVTFADKAAVRDYVTAAVGDHHLPRCIAVLDDAEGLRTVDLPESFVVKPTHGSGAVVVVSPDAPETARLTRPDWGWVYQHVQAPHANIDALVATAASWLQKLYGRGPNHEWAYSRVTPRVIVEEVLAAPDGSIPDDYKFFVFHQTCQYIQVDAGRFGDRTQDFYRPDWHHLPLSGGPPWAATPRPRPRRLAEMIELAETLARDTDFVRVDLYHLPDRVVVGELTSYPAGGDSPFDPVSFDAEFGSHWSVPRRYRAAFTSRRTTNREVRR
ncbi:ATP-grasp fold amidoligase family protein [Subtercola sp. YIM 133946]|uniref:ATP-grasp fold amidoligase family protein n=1 Tax=Subtercola sp. YIM 133946 TaxID=3118909 RepID=UPI002F953A9B